MRDAMPRLVLLLCAAAAIAAAPTLAAPRHAASTRRLDLRFVDRVQEIAFPPAAGSALCYSLSSSSRSVAFGSVRIGPFTDVEVAPSDPRCHQPVTVRDTLAFAGGTLQVQVSGPQLCYGMVETLPRTFTVVGGTGVFAGATGQGQAPISILQSGATEHWQGDIQAQGLPPAANPVVTISSARTTPHGKTARLAVVFAVRASGWPSTISYVLTAVAGGRHRTTSGSLPRSGTRSVSLTVPNARTVALVLHVEGSGGQVTLRRLLHRR